MQKSLGVNYSVCLLIYSVDWTLLFQQAKWQSGSGLSGWKLANCTSWVANIKCFGQPAEVSVDTLVSIPQEYLNSITKVPVVFLHKTIISGKCNFIASRYTAGANLVVCTFYLLYVCALLLLTALCHLWPGQLIQISFAFK